MTRNLREFQYLRLCPKCGGSLEWQKLTRWEQRDEGLPESFFGYFYCENCDYKDMRGVDERWPGFVTRTNSTASVLGMAADTLKRLYKKDPSLNFIINEGGNLISHASSLEAWNQGYESRKRTARRESASNYLGWFAIDASSGSVGFGK